MSACGCRAGRLVLSVALVATLAGCSRVTGLPPVPDTLTRQDAGLDGLDRLGAEAQKLASSGDPGIAVLAARLAAEPSNLVIGNAFRMQVYRAKRAYLAAASSRGERSPALPAELAGEPMATLKRAASGRATRELGVQIALAHVDEMVLNPALEVKAPASIDSVHAFTAVLAEAPYYVPALVGRGLNHLNRPRHLVWPEHPAPPADAASTDLALAAAVGAKVGGASPRVKGLLLLLLGDAYAHEGKSGLARSWWTLAAAATNDRGVTAELALRAGWSEADMADRLEARLEERMEDADAPLSDLSFLWDDSARGPW